MSYQKSQSIELPLKEAYPYGEAHGRAKETNSIRGVDPPKGVHPSIYRRALIAELFTNNNIMERFISECWPQGNTSKGRSLLRRYEQVIRRHRQSGTTPLANHDNDHLVEAGLTKLGQGLAPYIERELKAYYRDQWWDRGVRPTLKGDAGKAGTIIELDVQALLNILRDRRTEIFQSRLENEGFAHVALLLKVRNRLSHKKVVRTPFSPLEVRHALDTMTLFLNLISSDRAEEVAALTRTLHTRSITL